MDDAINQAAFRVWSRIGDFDPTRSTLGQWFFLITRNALITSLRAHAADRLIEMVSSDALDGRPATRSKSGRDGVQEKERLLSDLAQCVDALGPMQRDIVLADLAAGGPVEAETLAARWSTTPGSIWSSRHRAHQRLRECLRQKGHLR